MHSAQSALNRVPRSVIFWGGTGQAKVLRPIVEHWGGRLAAVFDDTPGLEPPFADVPLFQGWSGFLRWRRAHPGKVGFCVAIGNPHGGARIRIHERLAAAGLEALTVAHPTAFIDPSVTLGAGCQVLAGAVITARATLRRQCIVNTRASVDHECVLEDGVEIAPGAVLCGLVQAGKRAWVCAGATVLPRVRIGRDAVVGAGAVVIYDVPAAQTVIGVPARILRRKKEVA